MEKIIHQLRGISQNIIGQSFLLEAGVSDSRIHLKCIKEQALKIDLIAKGLAGHSSITKLEEG